VPAGYGFLNRGVGEVIRSQTSIFNMQILCILIGDGYCEPIKLIKDAFLKKIKKKF
jgi:hypothetical protein